MSVKRRFQHCMEVVYEEKEVPIDVVPAFLAFNQANRLVKEIIDKEGPLLASIQLVVKVQGIFFDHIFEMIKRLHFFITLGLFGSHHQSLENPQSSNGSKIKICINIDIYFCIPFALPLKTDLLQR